MFQEIQNSLKETLDTVTRLQKKIAEERASAEQLQIRNGVLTECVARLEKELEVACAKVVRLQAQIMDIRGRTFTADMDDD